jgi:DNA repair protein RadC
MTKQILPYVSDQFGNYTFHSTVNKKVLISLALELIQNDYIGETLTSPQATKDFLRLRLSRFEHEVFAVIFLDNRHRVIAFEEMFRGTIDGASVHPREVVKEALKHNAAAVIFAHNHPSGVAEPSRADESITHRLKDALALVDVRVLDHFVIGDDVVSFTERGLI